MKKLLALLLACCFMLCACGRSYTVSADSLRDYNAVSGINYFLEPGDVGVAEDDLFYRELFQLITPVFNSRGWNVVIDKSVAHNVARVQCWQDEPRVETHTTLMTQSYPIVVGHGRHRHIEYVHYETPVTESRTIYTANLFIEARAMDKKNGKEHQIWRTSLRCSSLSPDIRTLIYTMAQVLPQVLATSSDGTQYYDVFYARDGEITVTLREKRGLW